MMEDHDFRAHPDPAVRIWHDHLEGDSPTRIARWHDLSRKAVLAVLEAKPPAMIRSDLRYMTGLRGIWIDQDRERGATPLLDGDGLPHPFLVILVPHRTTGRALQAGLRAIRAAIRSEGHARFDFGTVAERAPLEALFAVAQKRGIPVWRIDETGFASRHAPEFRNLTPDLKEEASVSPET